MIEMKLNKILKIKRGVRFKFKKVDFGLCLRIKLKFSCKRKTKMIHNLDDALCCFFLHLSVIPHSPLECLVL